MNGRTASTLPAEFSPLIGRERELHDLVRLLRGGTRLLTLRGPGGVGKTALALRLAHLLQAHFDHVQFVDLSALREPRQLLPVVAAALLPQERRPSDAEASVFEFITGRRVLLVLDNFEHLLPAATGVADLLTAAPTLQVVATSRASLRLHDEHEYPVEPLPVPDAVATAADNPAVLLFTTRARATHPDFTMTGDAAAQVTRLCVRLEGMPLALELAAARLRTYALPDILEGLDHLLTFLRADYQDRPERLRSLRAAVEWSYDLLDDEDRAVFECCAVFEGSFTPDALLAVHGDADVLDRVEALIEQSLVRRVPTGTTRWTLLQPLRELALERLASRTRASAWRERHALHFLRLLEEGRARFRQGEPDRREHLLPDYPNMRAGLLWALDRREADVAYRFLAELGAIWLPLGLYAHEADLAERVLRLPAPPQAHTRVHALEVSAQCLVERGRLAEYETRLHDIVRGYRELHDDVGAGWAKAELATLHHARGDSARSWQLQQEVLSAYESGPAREVDPIERSCHANTLLYTVPNLLDLGEHHLALRQATRALETYEAARNVVFTLFARVMLAVALLHVGRRDDAATRLGDVLREADARTFRAVRDEALRAASLVAADTQDWPLVVRLLAAGRFDPSRATLAYLDRRHHAHLERARTSLGAPRFLETWTAGADMSAIEVDRQVDHLARTALPRPSTPPADTLTPRERDVLLLVCEGHPDRRIATLLGISPTTVSKHVASMLGKLGLRNRVELTRWALGHGDGRTT
ncbi:LuxR C-terminal-related transcriptional regulator [Deinococcus pimensis]|uniref:LuxR C-terminal-related transcriptional regulator n=1 Tax=Deinococcus pimensis TaxID=309888 RepID=UPI0004888911|nr:LuxR C-terminal-related transcriptional regulator [Deinococcus pimensis]